MNCLICGEKKEKEEFKNVMYFSMYKKRKMNWCRDCQTMYVAMKKEKEAAERLAAQKINYLVAFQ